MSSIDEARLTAYALSELTPEESRMIEAEIASDPQAQAFVLETRALADQIRAGLKAGGVAPLEPSEFKAMEAALRKATKPAPVHSLRVVTLLAAALVLSAGIYLLTSTGIKPRDVGTVASGTGASHESMAVFTESVPAAILSNLATEIRRVGDAGGDLPKLEELKQWQQIGYVATSQNSVQNNLNLFESIGAGSERYRGGRQAEPAGVYHLDTAGVHYSGNSVAPDAAIPGEFRKLQSLSGGNYRGPGDSAPATHSTLDGKGNGTNVHDQLGLLSKTHDDVDGLRANNGSESYQSVRDNAFQRPLDAPLSTFSIDVDTAAYANIRRFLTGGSLPPRDAVRVEELINYFTYGDTAPTNGAPFRVGLEIAPAPWNTQNRLVRIGIKAREITPGNRGISNLVFLVDVSGSMASENKLPLAKEGLKLLVRSLDENDFVSIVTYAGSTRVALPSTNASQKDTILAAIEALHSGGSTDGASGLQLAYEQATKGFVKDGVNRVVLMTDGDFNVGITQQTDLWNLITEKKKSGVYLSVLGFGMGNLKDGMMEQLADRGNGNYSYIDTLREARKVLVDQMSSTFVTVAKDVKLQVEFNPAKVAAYRLIGYENRVIAAKDFNDDKKDAGEIGAGHSVVALYEIIPAGADVRVPESVDPLKYQTPPPAAPAPVQKGIESNEWLTVKLRYKNPDAEKSQLLEFPLDPKGAAAKFETMGADYQFSAAVAAFGMLLRESPHAGNATFNMVAEIAEASKGADLFGYRREFIDLVHKARTLAGK